MRTRPRSEESLVLYELQYICAGEPGKRSLWATSPAAASRCLRDHASMFGLPHERVLVLRVRPIGIREAGLARQ